MSYEFDSIYFLKNNEKKVGSKNIFTGISAKERQFIIITSLEGIKQLRFPCSKLTIVRQQFNGSLEDVFSFNFQQIWHTAW